LALLKFGRAPRVMRNLKQRSDLCIVLLPVQGYIEMASRRYHDPSYFLSDSPSIDKMSQRDFAPMPSFETAERTPPMREEANCKQNVLTVRRTDDCDREHT
jgi:hypothetical protein